MKGADAVRFLIIGASGFLGQTVYAKLKEQHIPVTGTCPIMQDSKNATNKYFIGESNGNFK